MSQQKRPKNMIKLNLIEKHLTYTLNIDTISRFFIILLIEEERQAKFEKKVKIYIFKYKNGYEMVDTTLYSNLKEQKKSIDLIFFHFKSSKYVH